MLRKLGKIVAYTSLVLLILVGLFVWAIWVPTPEVDESISPDSYNRVKVGTDHYQVGNNWLKKNQYGIWEMYIEGDPYERGVIYGVLAEELVQKQEVHFVDQINELIPNKAYLNFLKYFVAWFNKDIYKNVPLEYQQEMYGISRSFSDEYDFIGPKYYRILNYHAAHDIGHALNDFNMVGCSSFAVDHDRSADGQLLIGRNFDFYVGDDFAEDKLLTFVNPTDGYKFASYSWGGLMGVVSGMNEKGLTVTINASKSDIPLGAKDPISILTREILQYASNTKEAIAIAQKRETFVSEAILVGSAADDKVIVIEKSPTKMDVYEPSSNAMACTNHYQSELFSNDEVNKENILVSDSKYRFDRLQQLLDRYAPIDVVDAAAILRDRNGIDDTELGLGNPKALNQLIAHHSVMFKPQQRLLWVSTPPYQLGTYVTYDLNKVFNDGIDGEVDSLNIPPDPLVGTDTLANYELYKDIKLKINRFCLIGQPFDMDEATEERFISYNPESYVTYMLLGDYYRANKSYEKAIEYYQISLTKEVASQQEKQILEDNIATCKKKLKK